MLCQVHFDLAYPDLVLTEPVCRVPFEYSSGSSIRGRTKVHYMANKKLKCNLHMASLTAVKLDGDLKAYYERKVGEGKSKLSVLNAVKSKLLARVVAVVNKQQEYVKKSA